MTKRLDDQEFAFFDLVSRAAFANPFGPARHALDLEIAGVSESTPREVVLERVVTRVWARMSAIEPIQLDDYTQRDRDVLELAVLFASFHKFSPQIDTHIRRQEKAGDKPIAAEFAADVIADLTLQGVRSERAKRFLEIFFQIRRAYYFIAESLVGESASMQVLRSKLWDNVFTTDMRLYEGYLWNRMEDFSTLIIGETGTGKGTAAAAIGRSGYIPYDPGSRRFAHCFTASFVPVNISQYPESLIESELFGHKKGAFTGAVESHQGVFQRCMEHGTIFLDEIGETSAQVQIKLLRVLQERSFSPVGSHDAHRFEGRVIAATNQSIVALREAGRFRDDFYYRLCSDVVEVPPLRIRIAEAPSELELLMARLVERTVGAHSEAVIDRVRSAIAKDLPANYSWPGNVRELEQCIRRVIVSSTYHGDTLSAGVDSGKNLVDRIEAGDIEAKELLGRYCSMLYRRIGTYEDVGKAIGLDRRTVKKYIDSIEESD